MKLLKSFFVVICVLFSLDSYAVYNGGSETVKQGQSKRINVPQWAIDDYNRNDGSGYSWTTSNSSALRIQLKNREYCDIYPTSSFPENGEVELSYKYNVFKYGRLDEIEIRWTVRLEKTYKLTLSASPKGGIVSAGTVVTLTAKYDNETISDANIYYTLDGNKPSASSTQYTSSGITVSESCELKAVAMKIGYTESDILETSYTVNSSFVDEPTEDWSESANYTISWYNKNISEYVISTNKELSGMAYLVNNGYTDFKGKTIKLSADIDLTGKKWTPCGEFYGNFDGQNHTIRGVYIKAIDDCGFWTYTKGTIKNLTIEGVLNGSTSDYYKYGLGKGDVGGFTAEAGECTFDNCHSRINIICTGDIQHVGGIVGNCGSSVKLNHCTYKGDIYCETPKGADIGGLACLATRIEYCESRIQSLSVVRKKGEGYKNGGTLISGICASGSSYYCSSYIDKLSVDEAYPNTNEVKIRGIGCVYNCVNCYSVIREIETNSTKLSYYGMTIKINNNGVANYSNNDVIGLSSMSEGIHGSTNYSSSQMKTEAFLEELNTYSVIELGGSVWSFGSDGYPCIASNWDNEEVLGILISSIELSKTSLSLQTGQEETLKATVRPDNATDKTVTWSAKPEDIVTVSSSGEVKAISSGKAVITCKANDGSGVSATCEVIVNDKPKLKGDVDGDGEVRPYDLVELADIIMKKVPEKAAAEIDGEEGIDVGDYVELVKILTTPATTREVMTGAIAATEATATLQLAPLGISAGETREISVLLTNPDYALTAVQFDMQLPEGLSLKRVGPDFAINMGERTNIDRHTLNAVDIGNAVRFMLVSNSNEVIKGKEGSVIRLTLATDERFTEGTISLLNIVGVAPEGKKIYLPASSYNMLDGNTTGISRIGGNDGKTTVYGLSGRKAVTTKKGINIVDGKIIIKK